MQVWMAVCDTVVNLLSSKFFIGLILYALYAPECGVKCSPFALYLNKPYMILPFVVRGVGYCLDLCDIIGLSTALARFKSTLPGPWWNKMLLNIVLFFLLSNESLIMLVIYMYQLWFQSFNSTCYISTNVACVTVVLPLTSTQVWMALCHTVVNLLSSKFFIGLILYALYGPERGAKSSQQFAVSLNKPYLVLPFVVRGVLFGFLLYHWLPVPGKFDYYSC